MDIPAKIRGLLVGRKLSGVQKREYDWVFEFGDSPDLVIGLRHSWLSREIVAFSAFIAFTATYALALRSYWPGAVLVGAASAATGFVAVACSAMVYASTRRQSWSIGKVSLRFLRRR